MIYLCEACGKWGGLALALAQPFENLGKALRGEKVKQSNEVICPDGHGPMRQVDENIRLQVKT
jgi:hypothetical protein